MLLSGGFFRAQVGFSPECQLASCLNPLRNWLVLPRFRKVRVPKGKPQQPNPSTQDVDGAQARELKISDLLK
ncbi:MAG: hypothetical protein IJU92_03115, partial [Spirochaetaceae bacterium]|nr:hypothetical protein [Spirochaetaceae bacterium]